MTLPDICAFKNLFHINCPGCGLTRSFISISRMRLDKAWQYNRAGIIVYVFVILQIPYRLYLVAKNSRTGNPRIDKIFRVYLYVIFCSLILNWLTGFYLPSRVSPPEIHTQRSWHR
ncbi:MAG: DUF2752 domain-containing protein [Nitrospirae bacterium]|uniref:DUF2752 domain-containing protein n=1 Tax=Candidatus Magnetobacterium casense TaxID=1455061 RepID=UPI00138E4C59|nr:DUF2752 domain-containing protein [Nitrospirota bacterium]